MKRFIKKFLHRVFVSIVMVVLVLNIFANWTQIAQASTYADQSDTMTRIKISETADHTIRWQLPTGIDFDVADNTDVMRIDFPHSSAFTQSGTWVTGDFTLTANDGARTLTVNAVDQSAAPNIDCTVAAGADNVCIAIETDTHIFTIKPSANFTATTVNTEFVLTIDGTSGDGTLTNPSGADDYTVSLAMCDEQASCTSSWTGTHTGALAVVIIANEQVVVSATVDPSISLTLSTNAVSMGTLSSLSVATAAMTVQTVTNALNGYSATVLENNNLRIDVSNDIDDVAGGVVDAGSEEYGLSTSDAGQTITQYTSCSGDPATAITGTAKTFGGATSGPVNETVTLCFAASITGTTTAGAYTHTLNLISTGLF